jgi:hypothetical protein
LGSFISFVVSFGLFAGTNSKSAPVRFALSVWPNIRPQEQQNGFSIKYDTGEFTKVCLHFQILVKFYMNAPIDVPDFIWGPTR